VLLIESGKRTVEDFMNLIKTINKSLEIKPQEPVNASLYSYIMDSRLENE